MSKAISGYELKITAFLPCGSSAADHAAAKLTIDNLSAEMDKQGCGEIEVSDKWAPKHKVAESPT